MFDSLTKLPAERRWSGQSMPAPIVAAIIRRRLSQVEEAFLLIRRNGNTYTDLWALIGGKWDFGETLAAAIVREVREESGLESCFVGLKGLVSERIAPTNEDEEGAHFLLLICELGVVSGSAVEQGEGPVRWFSEREIEGLHQDGKIIPSDYAMLHQFKGAGERLPYFEGEMAASAEAPSGSRLHSFQQVK